MKVVDPGHRYELNWLDGPVPAFLQGNGLRFVKREGQNYPGNIGNYSGTTVQEVLRAICDRLRYVNSQIPSYETEAALSCCREAIRHLEVRAAIRHGRSFAQNLDEVEFGKTCEKCNHNGCKGECH